MFLLNPERVSKDGTLGSQAEQSTQDRQVQKDTARQPSAMLSGLLGLQWEKEEVCVKENKNHREKNL